jgi:hypothetical protein
MEVFMRKFVELKDVTISIDELIGFGIGEYKNEEEQIYILSIWLTGVSTPIVSLYEDVEQRDKEYKFIRECIEQWNKRN